MTRKSTRRRFLQSSLAVGGYFLTAPAFSASRVFGANEKLRVAGVGVNGKGFSDIEQAGKLMEVVGLCDIDDERLGKRATAFPNAKKFFDFRKMFEDMSKEFDAVVVSCPDHMHALPSIMAMKMGKHVYCQKPLTHTVFEARLMREVAKKHNVCTQMGNQGSALNGLRRAVELIQSGVIGNVTEAHVWTNRPAHYWKQAPDIVSRPKDTPPVPANVHWEEFIGVAQMRPYNRAYHPHDWRGYWEFGTGAMGDMACHTANMAFRALNLAAPLSVKAEAGELNPETYPAWAHITYQFAARDKMVGCTLHWYEGKKDGKKVLPPEELLAKLLKKDEKLADSGSILVGDKGILFSPNDYGAKFRLTPEKDFVGVQTTKPEKRTPGTDSGEDPFMKEEWVKAIMANKPELAASNFDYAGQLTETMLLGNIAIRHAGTTLEWDPVRLGFPNSPAATKLVSKEYRKGWDLLKV